MTDEPRDETERLTGPRRWAVRFHGEPVLAAKEALERRGIPIISAGAFFPASSPGPKFEDHTAVGVLAMSEEDAIRHVREALEGVGDFDEFEAVVLPPTGS